MVFTGRRLPGERYSCGCAEGPGTDHGVCSRCGQPVTIEARLRGSEVACFRIDPRELQEGMLLLQGDRFYKVLGLYPPNKKEKWDPCAVCQPERVWPGHCGYGLLCADPRIAVPGYCPPQAL